ncbi:S41 family peptidase [Flavobacterium algicola]|uniref:S41 family peptidase n=1 Tax=Flavobacterium algicola TaxID=556529 RepID=UPI001EFD3D9B|nr:S41 family peptidase [Flavobacterium algicola]MCG9791141.1 S41 family peptidase [Flavobacterium algicola]
MPFINKIVASVFIILFFVQCNSVKRYNEHLQELVTVQQLHSDIDYTYKKLQQLHPNLYGYVDKKTLDFKFDSLKKTITIPLKPVDFYKKLSPIVASVHQGHTQLYGPTVAFTKKETKELLKKGRGPLSQFEFDYIDNKLYVTKNKSSNKSVLAGTEVLAINDINPSDLIAQYTNYYSSDGYNTTFKKLQAAKRFPGFFTIENGIKDSLEYQFKYKDSIYSTIIRRAEADTTKKEKTKIVKTENQKENLKIFKKKKKTNGYNEEDKNFNRNLDFMQQDSSVALMKIRKFTNGNYKRFYKQSFKSLQDHKTKTLILDLRNNGGGRLSEITYLYTYLSKTNFRFLQKTEVVSSKSLLKGAYWNGGSIPVKILKTIFAPFAYTYLLLTVHKDDKGKNYYTTETRQRSLKNNVFKGDIYVLINGGSFSASSLLSSNLKGSNRATFVGEETGGAYNGTVAGFMPVYRLPNSHLKIRIGIMNMKPYYLTTIDGYGIFPDQEIDPTLEDLLTGRDPELEWILEDTKNDN